MLSFRVIFTRTRACFVWLSQWIVCHVELCVAQVLPQMWKAAPVFTEWLQRAMTTPTPSAQIVVGIPKD